MIDKIHCKTKEVRISNLNKLDVRKSRHMDNYEQKSNEIIPLEAKKHEKQYFKKICV